MMKICNKILNRNLHISNNIKYFSVKPSDKIDDTKVSFVKINTNDIKNFGKKFSDDDKKKFMDPFGFLSSTDCNLFLLIILFYNQIKRQKQSQQLPLPIPILRMNLRH